MYTTYTCIPCILLYIMQIEIALLLFQFSLFNIFFLPNFLTQIFKAVLNSSRRSYVPCLFPLREEALRANASHMHPIKHYYV